VKPVLPDKSETKLYDEPFHKYNLELSGSFGSIVVIRANSPATIPVGDVSANKAATVS
jgi:hypothetical protein